MRSPQAAAAVSREGKKSHAPVSAAVFLSNDRQRDLRRRAQATSCFDKRACVTLKRFISSSKEGETSL